MRYFTYDANGNITGAFIQDLQPEHFDHHVEVSEEQYANRHSLYCPNGVVTEKPAPTPEQIAAAQETSRIAAIPTCVSPRQIRQALTRIGLRGAIESAVSAGDQDLKDWYEFATEFQRNNPHVIDMSKALGVSERQLDDLWTLAGSL